MQVPSQRGLASMPVGLRPCPVGSNELRLTAERKPPNILRRPARPQAAVVGSLGSRRGSFSRPTSLTLFRGLVQLYAPAIVANSDHSRAPSPSISAHNREGKP